MKDMAHSEQPLGQSDVQLDAQTDVMPPLAEGRSLANMLVAVLQAREAEAARVSRVLHDEVGQVLSAVGLQLTVLRMDHQQELPALTARTQEIQDLLERAVTKIRSLSYELHSAVVERAGLSFAMDRLMGQFRTHYTGTLRAQIDPQVHVPLPVGNVFYTIAERALDNAVRHAQAHEIQCRLKRAANHATLEIRDNGVGFSIQNIAEKPVGLGLLLMRFDAQRAGVELTVRSEPGGGTLVRAIYRQPPSPA